ncbi:MAG: hypothetical protein AAFX99_10440 [Myxococcota bacterium]
MDWTSAGHTLRVALWMTMALSVGCAQQVGDIDRTQPDRIHKASLDGTWYVRHTLVEGQAQ